MADSSAPRSRRKVDERTIAEAVQSAGYGGVSLPYICRLAADVIEGARSGDKAAFDEIIIREANTQQNNRFAVAAYVALLGRLVALQADPKVIVKVLREVK